MTGSHGSRRRRSPHDWTHYLHASMTYRSSSVRARLFDDAVREAMKDAAFAEWWERSRIAGIPYTFGRAMKPPIPESCAVEVPPTADPAAGTVSPETDPAKVTGDGGIVDSDPDRPYGDRVEQVSTFSPADSASRKGRSRGDAVATSAVTQRREARIAQERAVLPQKPGTAGGVAHTCSTASGDPAESPEEREAKRQARLRLWQAQR